MTTFGVTDPLPINIGHGGQNRVRTDIFFCSQIHRIIDVGYQSSNFILKIITVILD